jgi:hypothetical protein
MKRRSLLALFGLVSACAVSMLPTPARADMCFGGGSRDNDPVDSGSPGSAGSAGAVSMKLPAQGGFAFGAVAAASIGMCWLLLRRSDRKDD